jgi:hypothetical protein
MPAFQFYNPAPVFLDLLGLGILDGGSLTFYDLGTTNPRNTWSDPALAVGDLNPNPVPLDSAGRANAPIFLSGEYTVVCKDSLGATIWSRNIIPGGDTALTIPALQTGKFLSNDGTNLIWQSILQMPDATGSTGQYPVTNGGGGYTLQDVPDVTPPDPEIEVTATTFQAGVSTDATKMWFKRGTGSAPSSGTKFTSVTISFSPSFDSLWGVIIIPMNTSATPAGAMPTWSVSGYVPGNPSTGVTVNFNIPDDDSTSNWKFNAAVDFAYIAIGNREIP